MTRIIRGYFDGPNGQLHYRHCGEGEPLLLLHQSTLSSTQFIAVMPALADRGYAVVAAMLAVAEPLRVRRPGFFAFAALQGGNHHIIDQQPREWVAAVNHFLRPG